MNEWKNYFRQLLNCNKENRRERIEKRNLKGDRRKR